ncbi:MAG TPA: hypothetical protein VGM26_10500 [Rhizomicrobium sp.]
MTGAKSHETVTKFVESFATPTRRTGKIARWENGVCPVTVGLKPTFTKFISQRIRDVAAQVGAPVDADVACKPNIEIVFTTTPQGLMDNVRAKQSGYLGYHDNSHQADDLAKITRPIQAWYTTVTRDLHGRPMFDSASLQGVGGQSSIENDSSLLAFGASAITGSRLGDGRRSGLYHVIIVAEPAKLLDHEIGALADYITLLALTQISSLDTCQQLSSVVNMLASGCAPKVNALTSTDLAYLRGLYRMGPGRALRAQEDEVAYQMEQKGPGR